MLEKLNSFAHSQENGVLLKHVVDRRGAEAEAGTLMELNSIAMDSSTFSFNVPALHPKMCTLYSVAMSELTGIRLLDTLALLNKMTEAPPVDAVARNALRLRDSLIQNSLESVAVFQSSQVQSRLKRNLGSFLAVYDYFGKFREALEYISALCGSGVELKLEILEEAEHLCGVLSKRARVVFRDGSLKNRILVRPQSSLSQKAVGTGDTRSVPGCFRPSEQPWTDTDPILEMVRSVDDPDFLTQQI